MNAEKGTTLGLLPSALIAAMADLASVPKTLCFHFLLRKFAVGIDFIKQQWFHANAPPRTPTSVQKPNTRQSGSQYGHRVISRHAVHHRTSECIMRPGSGVRVAQQSVESFGKPTFPALHACSSFTASI